MSGEPAQTWIGCNPTVRMSDRAKTGPGEHWG